MASAITLQGWLARDPDLRYTQQGSPVVTLTIPEEHQRYNRETRRYESYDPPRTTWREVSFFGSEAEWYAGQLRKGDEVIVTGPEELETRNGQDGRTYYTLKVRAKTIAKVLRPPKNQGQQEQSYQNGYAARAGIPQQGYSAPPQGNQAPQADHWAGQAGSQGWGAAQPGQGAAEDTPPF